MKNCKLLQPIGRSPTPSFWIVFNKAIPSKFSFLNKKDPCPQRPNCLGKSLFLNLKFKPMKNFLLFLFCLLVSSTSYAQTITGTRDFCDRFDAVATYRITLRGNTTINVTGGRIDGRSITCGACNGAGNLSNNDTKFTWLTALSLIHI